MSDSIFNYFLDPVLRAPTIGCMLMCLSAALVGVIVFLKKESLLGESLSHAAYPGVIMGVIIAGFFDITESQELSLATLSIIGAFITSLLGLWIINFLKKKLFVRSDSALCFVLAAFFGIGITMASQVQFIYPSLYRQVLVYLYGQAATMTDEHILIYGILAFSIVLAILFFYKEIKIITFDENFAISLGINTKLVNTLIFLLIVLSVVIGIRSVGVVLMSAMLIAPAVAGRQYTNKLYKIFILAGFFGLLSGFLGNYLSVKISMLLTRSFPNTRLTLPTGPMIVVIASLICLLSLLFAPKKGLFLRLIRIALFRYRCMSENILKAIWRSDKDHFVSFEDIAKTQDISILYLTFVLKSLSIQGWLEQVNRSYRLTSRGAIWAARIVRLHRLWEVYLVDYLSVGIERVHRSAEEMEHIITKELEAQLTTILNNPKYDPHHQPIPSYERPL